MPIMNENPLFARLTVNTGNGKQSSSSFSPQEWEYIQALRRTGNYQDYQQPYQQPMSDPYSDFEMELNKCSSMIQAKIMNDDGFKQSMRNCDEVMQRYIENIVRPQVMQTGEGRIAFEKLLANFRSLRDKYSKEEMVHMEKLNKIMKDEVVQKRLAEIEKSEGVSNE